MPKVAIELWVLSWLNKIMLWVVESFVQRVHSFRTTHMTVPSQEDRYECNQRAKRRRRRVRSPPRSPETVEHDVEVTFYVE